ncbi:MAG: hypothetical protein WCK84_12085, partial [Bacteroidota bacterium]
TCCKLLKKSKNTNLFEIAKNKCVTFQRVKDPCTPGTPGSISKPQGGLLQGKPENLVKELRERPGKS